MNILQFVSFIYIYCVLMCSIFLLICNNSEEGWFNGSTLCNSLRREVERSHDLQEALLDSDINIVLTVMRFKRLRAI